MAELGGALIILSYLTAVCALWLIGQEAWRRRGR